jgi:hypothetical protein
MSTTTSAEEPDSSNSCNLASTPHLSLHEFLRWNRRLLPGASDARLRDPDLDGDLAAHASTPRASSSAIDLSPGAADHLAVGVRQPSRMDGTAA